MDPDSYRFGLTMGHRVFLASSPLSWPGFADLTRIRRKKRKRVFLDYSARCPPLRHSDAPPPQQSICPLTVFPIRRGRDDWIHPSYYILTMLKRNALGRSTGFVSKGYFSVTTAWRIAASSRILLSTPEDRCNPHKYSLAIITSMRYSRPQVSAFLTTGLFLFPHHSSLMWVGMIEEREGPADWVRADAGTQKDQKAHHLFFECGRGCKIRRIANIACPESSQR